MDIDLVFRFRHAHPFFEHLDFRRIDRSRSSAQSDESGDIRRIADDIPRSVRHYHLHQNITGINFLFNDRPLACFNLYFLFYRNHDVKNQILHIHRFNSLLQVARHIVFVTAVSMDHVPSPSVMLCLLCHIILLQMFLINS